MIRDLVKGVLKSATSKTVAKMEKRVEDKLNKALRHNIDRGLTQAKAEFYSSMLIIFSVVLILAGTLLIISKHFSLEYFLIIGGTIMLLLTLTIKK